MSVGGHLGHITFSFLSYLNSLMCSYFLISEVNEKCANHDFECTKFQGKCSHDGTDTFCKCEKDYQGPTCAGPAVFLILF